jgi:hypothetical protein
MKKTIFIILSCFAWNLSSAPGRAELCIVESKSINPYEAIFKAICEYESRNDTNAYNKEEDAVGIVQIRPIRILHFNQLSGKNYQLYEMHDPVKSKEVFMYFAQRLHNPDLVIRKWNGSGPKTYEYLKKIQEILVKSN